MARTIIVLGMHRSGTSCLAGILENAGVYFGAVSRSNLFNEMGNFENRQIMKLHDELLECNGGSWDNPPAAVKWPGHLKNERDRIIKTYGHAPLWGLKDPRVLFALDGWLEALPEVSLAATFRHPLSVARSLQRRNGFPRAKSLALWIQYNSRLLHYRQDDDFPLLSFDLTPEAYRAGTERLLRSLGLAGAPAGGEFFDPGLRHDVDPQEGLPPEVAGMYRRLQSCSQ